LIGSVLRECTDHLIAFTLEWEEMEELLRRIQAILREGMPPSL
jgi:hypothetical protein